MLHYIVGTRLRRGLLTVVDATNVQQARPGLRWSSWPGSHDVLVDAIVLDVPESRRVRAQRAASRPRLRRRTSSHGSAATSSESLGQMRKEGFRRVHVLRGVDEIDAAHDHPRALVERPPRPDRAVRHRSATCTAARAELRTLLAELGWELELDDLGRAVGARHPEGRHGASSSATWSTAARTRPACSGW